MMLSEPETNSCTNQAVISQPLIKKPVHLSESFDIDVFGKGCTDRNQAEQFIKQGYQKAYSAKISVSMPQILTVKNGNFKAALGIRSAIAPLFIEQYLSCAIEQVDILANGNISRKDIVEIGSLYSNANRFTVPLFMVTAVSLFYQNYQYLAFAGTSKVLEILSKAGIELSYLGEAKQSLLKPSTDSWGSYYETKPKVALIKLSDVIMAINKQPRYQKLFESLAVKIADVSKKLEVTQW